MSGLFMRRRFPVGTLGTGTSLAADAFFVFKDGRTLSREGLPT
jgi:hypothetical protein